MKKIEAFCACLCLIGSMKLVPAYAADAQSLRLNDAIHMALNSAPYIRGADADYGAAKSERRQAGTFINPEIGLSAENIAGSGAYKGTDEAEITLGLSQTVEVGGKRSARIKLADHGESVAQYGQSVARLNTIRDVKAAFAQAAAAQEEAVIAQEQFKLAQDVYKNVDKRVSAAAEPLVQRHKAKISMVNAELVLERAKTQKNTAFKMLTSLWGNHVISSVDKSDFYKITKPTTNKDIQNLLQHTIDYKQKSVAVDQAKSSIDLEKANAIPDPTFNVGIRQLRNTDDQAFIAGVSMPLPVFNQNLGNIEKARYLAVKADTERQKLLLDGQANVTERIQLLDNAYVTASKIKTTILPEAEKAFAQAKRGYNAGKFAYLEVLDAQRTLTDTRLSYIQAVRDYHIQNAELERLTAQDIVKGDKS